MKAQDFLQIRVAVTLGIREAVSNFLFENGALGIVEGENELLGYFDNSKPEEEILYPLFTYLNSLREIVEDFDIVVSTETIQNRDWNAEWKKSLRPLAVTEKILIKPSWVEKPSPAPPIVVEIDPEMAFGSGEHTTTQMTLQLVEKNVRSNTRLLDIGTGTGILAIAALMLGADAAFVFDIDAVAAQTAQRNAKKNGVAERFFAFAGTLDAVRDRGFDIIVANVNRSQIVPMLKRMSELLPKNGVCLISGIMKGEEQIIRDTCRPIGLTIDSLLFEQEWLAFETRKS